ncbi:hypothetical protein DICVIV_13083 [Dictyocaulus viviparus]|uniref:Uncharacterized protein n=1 Tax=Dictyocaulus viviparus TaxID=29172 RepID=A0A0D8XB01_DICVI|nr:hypothetical protein DICVIV_13083 [Dictyocaulus viviparus]
MMTQGRSLLIAPNLQGYSSIDCHSIRRHQYNLYRQTNTRICVYGCPEHKSECIEHLKSVGLYYSSASLTTEHNHMTRRDATLFSLCGSQHERIRSSSQARHLDTRCTVVQTIPTVLSRDHLAGAAFFE